MQRLVSIQAMRAAAALLVLLSHIELDFRTRLDLPGAVPDMTFGVGGVDLFFVISGFVMTYASQALFARPAATSIFLRRRLARIVPLYWAVTVLYVVLSRIVPDAQTQYGWDLVLASLLFWPPAAFFPVVGLGWTLNYEMFFYLLFGLALRLRRPLALAAVAGSLIGLVALGRLLALPGPLAFWADTVILEFLFGIALALCFQNGLRFQPWAGVFLIGAGCAALVLGSKSGSPLPRSVLAGLPALAILAGAVLTAWPAGWRALAAPALLVGDASYALYLTHAFVIRFFRNLAQQGALDPAAYAYLYSALIVLTAIATAIGVHLLFERPLTRLLDHRRTHEVVPA